VVIRLTVNGNGKFAGHSTNIQSYSVQEDSTPVSPADSSGGTGTVSITVTEDESSDGSILLLNDEIVLEDSVKGTTSGKVNSVSSSDAAVTLSGDSRLGILNATRYVPAHKGDVESAVLHILAIAGITSGIYIDPAVADIPAAVRGGTYQVWKLLGDMCSARQVEISLVSNNIVARPLRTREASLDRVFNHDWAVQNIDLAQFVEVYYYNYEILEDELVYPYGGWNPDVRVINSIDAGQTQTINIPVDEVNVSLTELQQPVVQDSVAREYVGPVSVYCVAGNDGLPIPAAQWTAQGGSLTVAIGEDGQSIDVTVTGASEAEYAPYQIAMSSGPSDYYSSLRLIGSGLGFTRKLVRFPTGAPAEKTAQEVGPTIDTPWIDTYNDAQAAALYAAYEMASARQTFSFDASLINRSSDSGSIIYPIFEDFNEQWPTEDFDAWGTEWDELTFEDFRQFMFEQVEDNFENQAFGNVGGARVRFRDAYYRIRSAGITESGVQGASAERDTLFSDFDALWTGETFEDFENQHSGRLFEDFARIPLNRPGPAPVGVGFGFGGFGYDPFGGGDA
jgi:hypothetical protein